MCVGVCVCVCGGGGGVGVVNSVFTNTFLVYLAFTTTLLSIPVRTSFLHGAFLRRNKSAIFVMTNALHFFATTNAQNSYILFIFRSQLIWLDTISKGRVYPGLAGQGLMSNTRKRLLCLMQAMKPQTTLHSRSLILTLIFAVRIRTIFKSFLPSFPGAINVFKLY